jgi:hypothetical protein
MFGTSMTIQSFKLVCTKLVEESLGWHSHSSLGLFLIHQSSGIF